MILKCTKHTILGILSFSSCLLLAQNTSAQLSDIKLRSPIRFWAGTADWCFCPYDQAVMSGMSLMIADERGIYECGKTSAWYRSGGREPACYLGDGNIRQQREAVDIERQCRAMGSRACYVDVLNRF